MKNPEHREGRREYKIREATPADAVAIAHIQYDSWLKTYPNKDLGITEEDVRAYLGKIEEKEKKWEKILNGLKKDEKVYVALDEEKVIGFCRIEKRAEEDYLNALYIDLAYEGTGMASQFAQQIMEYLGNDRPSMLEVAAHNKRAKSIYEHYGFVEAERKAFKNGVNGKEMPLIVMRRPAKT